MSFILCYYNKLIIHFIIFFRQINKLPYSLNAWNLKKAKKVCFDEHPQKWLNIDENNQIPSTWIPPKVVIIGAGIAGLSAAHRLVQCGLCNFTILEGSDR